MVKVTIVNGQSFQIKNNPPQYKITNLDELTDVDVNSPSNKSLLSYDSDSEMWIDSLSSYDISIFYPGSPTSSETLAIITVPRNVYFNNNFSNSVGSSTQNPTSEYTIDIQKNNSSIGSVVIATNGTYSFSSTGNTYFNTGDKLKLIGQSSEDASLSDVSITFVGFKY